MKFLRIDAQTKVIVNDLLPDRWSHPLFLMNLAKTHRRDDVNCFFVVRNYRNKEIVIVI